MAWWPRFVFTGARILSKTFVEAWKETGKRAAAAKATGGTTGEGGEAVESSGPLSVKESKLILGVEGKPSMEEIVKKYEHLYKVNEKDNGGSPYLQAKVRNAKLRLDEAYRKDEPIE